jgi:hypothetical protein
LRKYSIPVLGTVKEKTMNRMRIVASLLLVAILATSSIVYGEERVQKNGFSISLPVEWVEIPRDSIDLYEKELAQLAPNAKVEHYDYGFQLNSAKDWFECPYVLIQVKNNGRIPESQLEKLEGFSAQKTVDDQKEKLSVIMSDLQVGKMIYDSQNKMIWIRIESNVRDFGPVSGISGMVLTERGFILAHAYSAKNDFPNYESIFRSIATSVTPDPELAYRPKWSDSLPAAVTGFDWGKVVLKSTGKVVVSVIIIGIVTLIARLRRRKNGKFYKFKEVNQPIQENTKFGNSKEPGSFKSKDEWEEWERKLSEKTNKETAINEEMKTYYNVLGIKPETTDREVDDSYSESLKIKNATVLIEKQNEKPENLYRAFLGEKNQIYYLTKFENFDQQSSKLQASWNWAAFFNSGVWALYRKMYGWFFAFWGIFTLSSIFEKCGADGISFLVLLVALIAFSAYADSLYHRRVKKKIAAAQLSVRDTSKLLEFLRYKGGVHTWVIWVGASIPIIGILAAIIIPQINVGNKRMTPSATFVDPFLEDPTKLESLRNNKSESGDKGFVDPILEAEKRHRINRP